ncbi:MAG: hypothetical protein QGH33_03700 [Pirellulaceae bacterium]|jgi:putative pyruvate formate lyase activating enzyme|nr:hypothetical protein [Pirellulaceae bacterium]MDP7302878.1 hypothetical protein [Pirellulaceae bacterium]HJN12064.1 hypothetical protein [Pirellulaceae bacterium]
MIDIYLPDFKFWSRQTAKRLAKAPDYPERTCQAIQEMRRQVGPLRFGPNGLARRGVLVRHLVMPGQLDETAAILRWLSEELAPETYVSIMGQYRPEHEVGEITGRGDKKCHEIDRRPKPDELRRAQQAARDAGLWRFDERWLP